MKAVAPSWVQIMLRAIGGERSHRCPVPNELRLSNYGLSSKLARLLRCFYKHKQ